MLAPRHVHQACKERHADGGNESPFGVVFAGVDEEDGGDV